MNQSKTFEAGATYWTRSVCDYECIYRATVISRTPKSVKVDIGRDAPVTRRVFRDHSGNEAIRPFGNYSMAAVISADKAVRP